MSSLSRSTQSYALPMPASPLSYPDVMAMEIADEATQPDAETVDASLPDQVVMSPAELEQILSGARTEAAAEMERTSRMKYEAKLAEQAEGVRRAVDLFAAQRRQYFARVEAEVIRLALAIAAKILHREAQADPMLVAAMVRIALDKIQEGSSVSLRVPMKEIPAWQEAMATPPHGILVEVLGDPDLSPQQCILQAELGTVDFSIEAQLKEVEQGFLDLLAQRPMPA